jgi:hypothetical protein
LGKLFGLNKPFPRPAPVRSPPVLCRSLAS